MPEHTWPTVLNELIERVDLSEDATAWAMDQVMSGEATPAQIAGFAVALRSKGETPAEISGMAKAMLAHAKRIELTTPTVDIVGTGGDRKGSVNISTMTSLVVAAAGTPVVKHGNRAASSKSGAADVLEALGVTIDSEPDDVRRCVEELGIGFCFAPVFHPAYRHTGPPRRELGVSTAFNLLGPLTNPAQPTSGLIGCAYLDKAPVLAEVYARRGHSVLLVRGDDGFDEITTTTTSTAWVVSNGQVRRTTIDPTVLGIPLSEPDALRGGDAAANAEVVKDLVGGKKGPVRDAVLLNAAGALAAYAGFSDDLTADLSAGLERATRTLDSGAAADLLDRWIKRS
ncbi:anthranilate phosphoribosyltransferase [Saccharomonospora azurea]|uniref:Anthranilate phosphoribosyltransferase n=1 Tax=Saccharomonospora azurea NA-128 TaxID=882081 RepID=H8GC14_9PSEU|nr:anthranilate phosphoribosyltransferase [Saccharomonospora azurea]EHY90783.1 anthranilate phosphoribosyltransferase [Saccharomonospora azurea NA-128]